MVYMIASDIHSLEVKALNDASQKEKMFYCFLMNGNESNSFPISSNIDQLCYDAFVLNLNASETLVKLQRSKPIKNIHYSTNMIELVAAAKIDFNNEEEHINEYLKGHNLKEAYLIYLALGIELKEGLKIETPIDKLIEAVLIKKSVDIVPELFTNSLLNATHIFDAIILKKMYALYLAMHPQAGDLIEFEKLSAISKKACSALNGIIMLTITIASSIIAVKYINWYLEDPKANDQMQKYLLSISSVVLLLALFLGLNIPDKTKVVTWIRYKILQFMYFLFGLKYADIDKILRQDVTQN